MQTEKTYNVRIPILSCILLRVMPGSEILRAEVSESGIPSLVISGEEPPPDAGQERLIGVFNSAHIFETKAAAVKAFEDALNGAEGDAPIESLVRGWVVRRSTDKELCRFNTEDPVKAEWIVLEAKREAE